MNGGPISAGAMRRALEQGETTSLALTRTALERIAAENPRTAIFISVQGEEALAEAARSDARREAGTTLGPADGIPVAIKDNIDVAGVTTTMGARGDATAPAGQDATVVARLRAAGAVILGKLNLHEGALGATTDNPFWGRCENPAAPGHTPGGSSGGSGAAVAGGIVAATLGTDTMGSVRIPAAYCGVWGLKPTRGLIGTGGLAYLSWTLDSIGPLAGNANDLALYTGILAGPDPRDAASGTAPAGWSMTPDNRPVPSDIRIGYPDIAALATCEDAVLEAFESVLERAREAGYRLHKVSVEGWEPGRARRYGLLISEAECGSLIRSRIEATPAAFSGAFLGMLEYGCKAPAEKLARAYWELDRLRLAALETMRGIDVMVLPTAPQRAFPHGTPAPANQADFTALANIAGLPAVAFPLPAPDGDRPCSAQLVGRPYGEARILGIAADLHRGLR
ncbi:amidase [Oceanibacterium hippocampi]|uniref:Glutamyl-tRNA(Gln) amidotransferase subunit A n=1 Tax=Oceanibacterium hippocampi TaxID=745714 RepID=A0A1Y5TWE9_9PROT|nr:amidase [Oceanibacterium hippocampi]SLN75347.1 Glutamyl-tRNA(Gln) amidotransferase subunit A [Oceanibacterium hippocampi]